MTATLEREIVDPVLRDSRHPGAAAARDQADWLLYLELGGMAPSSLFTYQWTTDKLLAIFPDKPLADFTDGDVAYLLKRFPADSRKNRLSAIDSWFTWAVRLRRITENPCDFLPRIKKPAQKVVQVFTEAEEAALCALPEPHGTLMAILFETGLRKGEARELRAKRVDFTTGHLLVIDGAKGSKQRVVPIGEDVAPGLLGRIAWMFRVDALEDNDYLWFTKPGGGRVRRDKPIGESSFSGWWAKQIEAAEVRYRKPHTTRHTYATRWRQRDLDLTTISKNLGHSSTSVTEQVYVHDGVHDAARRMADARSRSEGR